MPERERPYPAADRIRGGLLSSDRDRRAAMEPPRLPQLHAPRPTLPPRYGGADQASFDRALADPRVRAMLVPPIPADATVSQIYAATEKLQYRPRGPSEEQLKQLAPVQSFLSAAAGYDPMTKSRGHNDGGDARRHTWWGASTTRSLGAANAQRMQDAHERSVQNDEAEMLMDLINNHNGRVLASVLPGMRPEEIARRAARAGLLQTRPVLVPYWTE